MKGKEISEFVRSRRNVEFRSLLRSVAFDVGRTKCAYRQINFNFISSSPSTFDFDFESNLLRVCLGQFFSSHFIYSKAALRNREKFNLFCHGIRDVRALSILCIFFFFSSLFRSRNISRRPNKSLSTQNAIIFRFSNNFLSLRAVYIHFSFGSMNFGIFHTDIEHREGTWTRRVLSERLAQ